MWSKVVKVVVDAVGDWWTMVDDGGRKPYLPPNQPPA